MYHVSAQGVVKRMINVHYYYMFIRGLALCVYQRVHRICLPESTECLITTRHKGSDFKRVPRSDYQKVDRV